MYVHGVNAKLNGKHNKYILLSNIAITRCAMRKILCYFGIHKWKSIGKFRRLNMQCQVCLMTKQAKNTKEWSKFQVTP